MFTCPCGCGRPMSAEEYKHAIISHKNKQGFTAQARRSLAKMTDDERDEILDNASEELLDALGFDRTPVKKRPEHIFAEADLAGKNAQVQKLYVHIKAFYDEDARSSAEIKKLEEGRKKDRARIEELEGENQRIKRQLTLLRKQQKMAAGIAGSRKEGIENLQAIVAKKNSELAILMSRSISLTKLHGAISAIDTSKDEEALAQAISNLKKLVVEQKNVFGCDDAFVTELTGNSSFMSGKASSDESGFGNMSVEDVARVTTGG